MSTPDDWAMMGDNIHEDPRYKKEHWWPGDRMRCLKDIRDGDNQLVMKNGETGLVTGVTLDGSDRLLNVWIDPYAMIKVLLVWPCMIQKEGRATPYEVQNSHGWECYHQGDER